MKILIDEKLLKEAAYLWNKKEEVTTHKYTNYLDELRRKLEEYNK
jgi:hypothetical protein